MKSILRGATALAGIALAGSALAADLPRTNPESVGMSTDRLNTMRKVLNAKVDSGEIPGYVALVARHGKVAHERGWFGQSS